MWATSFSVGGAIGPVLGGAMLQHFWWGAVFLLAVPVMVLLLVLGPLLLPEYRDPAAGRLDFESAALSLVAVLSAIYGMKVWAKDGFGLLPLLCDGGAGCWSGWAFVRRQQRLADPLIDLRLFRVPAFRVSLATFTLTTLVVFGSYVFIAPVPAAGAGPVAAGGRPVDAAGIDRGHRRVDAGAGHRAPGAPGVRDGRRAGPGHRRLRRC